MMNDLLWDDDDHISEMEMEPIVFKEQAKLPPIVSPPNNVPSEPIFKETLNASIQMSNIYVSSLETHVNQVDTRVEKIIEGVRYNQQERLVNVVEEDEYVLLETVEFKCTHDAKEEEKEETSSDF